MTKLKPVLYILGLILVFYFGYQSHTPSVTNNSVMHDTTVVHDSIPVPVSVIKWKQLPAKLVFVHDTVHVTDSTNYAYMDTITVHGDTLHMGYAFPPVNQFDFRLAQAPRQKYIDTVFIPRIQYIEESTPTKDVAAILGVTAVIYQGLKLFIK